MNQFESWLTNVAVETGLITENLQHAYWLQ